MIENVVHLIALIVGFYWVFRKRRPAPFEPKEIDRTLDPDYPKAFIIHGGHRETTRDPSKPKLRIINRTLDPDSPKTIFFLRMGHLVSPEDSEDNSS